MENQDLIIAAQCGLAWVAVQKKSKRHQVFHELLERMCQLVIASNGTESRFRVKDLVTKVSELDSGQAKPKVFGKFDEKLKQFIESIWEVAVDEQFDYVPKVELDKSGKANVAIFTATRTPTQTITRKDKIPAGAIRYTFDEKHRFWRAFGFLSGMRLKTVPLIIAISVLLALGGMYLGVIVAFALVVLTQPSIGTVLGLVASLFVGYMLFRRIKAYDRFTTTRIALAHDALASLSAPQSVVVMKLNGDDDPTLDVISASAECPICNGEIRLRKPNFNCTHEVIGACRNNPSEHCFTFDHVTRLGWPITETARRHVFLVDKKFG